MKARAPRNRTITCTEDEMKGLSKALMSFDVPVGYKYVEDKVINQDFFSIVANLPTGFVDLLILDPPYNLSKSYDGRLFREKDESDYRQWFSSLVRVAKPLMKKDSTIYVCSDWKTSILIAPILEANFWVRNRITWEREKGRGAAHNWKNNAEDIWFCTVSEDYTFNLDAVKLKRIVRAPYRTESGLPKDWNEEPTGNFRITSPSNLWTDISVPFWAMRENTDHPTQKPEKLIAKLVLASSKEGDTVFDPFLGSGTTAVVARKLGRRFVGVEQSRTYCCWALKRLQMASEDASIQGYEDGIFWERNTLASQSKRKRLVSAQSRRLL